MGIVRAEATGNNLIISGRLEISGPNAATEHNKSEEQGAIQEPIRNSMHELHVLAFRILTAYFMNVSYGGREDWLSPHHEPVVVDALSKWAD